MGFLTDVCQSKRSDEGLTFHLNQFNKEGLTLTVHFILIEFECDQKRLPLIRRLAATPSPRGEGWGGSYETDHIT